MRQPDVEPDAGPGAVHHPGVAGSGPARGLPADPRIDGHRRLYARAMLLWPGLEMRRLRQTGGDPRKVARLVGRRTMQDEDAILRLLSTTSIEPED